MHRPQNTTFPWEGGSLSTEVGCAAFKPELEEDQAPSAHRTLPETALLFILIKKPLMQQNSGVPRGWRHTAAQALGLIQCPCVPWAPLCTAALLHTCVYVRAHADAHSPMHTRVPTGELSDESRSAKSNTPLAKGSGPFLSEIKINTFLYYCSSVSFSYQICLVMACSIFLEISRCSQMCALM